MVNGKWSILIAPLNWGLGHATRCVPLIDRYLAEGHRVTIGGDGESLEWLRRRYPDLPSIELAPLRLRYSAGNSQTWTLARQLPHILRWMIRDHRRLEKILREQSFDLILSDNRFGLFAPRRLLSTTYHLSPTTYPLPPTSCRIYLTHQLTIPLPSGWRWLEPLARRAHAYFINRYDRLWVPDYPDYPGLAGRLSHPDDTHPTPTRHPRDTRTPLARPALDPRSTRARPAEHPEYIGPLSRFSNYPLPLLGKGCPQDGKGAAVLLLSGLEPQRSLFRAWALRRYPDIEVIEGSVDDEYVARRLGEASLIVARSGYSTIMDLCALGLLNPFRPAEGEHRRILLVPTPGQPEQEYLASHLRGLVDVILPN